MWVERILMCEIKLSCKDIYLYRYVSMIHIPPDSPGAGCSGTSPGSVAESVKIQECAVNFPSNVL